MKIFSVFNILAAALFLVAVGMVAVPDSVGRAVLANEVHVVKLLEDLALAEVRYRVEASADRNEDGDPEYGFLPDITRCASRDLPQTDDRGSFTASGYRVTALLPSPRGRPLPFPDAREVDPELASRSFLLVAVPVEPGRTGYRAFAVRQDLIVVQCDATDPRWRKGTHALPRLARRDEATNQIQRPESWRSPWTPFLLEIQAPRMIESLRAGKLPVPRILLRLMEETD
jgi:hypothetical protein